MLVRRVQDLAQTVLHRGASRSTAFLSDRQQELARAALSGIGFTDYEFSGGYPDAERCILTLHGEYGSDEWPAQCILIEVLHAEKELTHRDYLGALMSLGIKRECIGDLVTGENGAFLFVLNNIAPVVLDELTSVGRCSVHVRTAQPKELPDQSDRPVKTASVSSLRLDALLAAMLHVSRGDAAQLVKSGLVEVNHVSTVSAHYDVYENDVFSVRGHGKYKLCEVGSRSRKGRTFVSYIEY